MTSPNTNTDLLERYLQAIGEHLPTATRQDVLAELRANLQAQLDDRAEELNRPLTEPEVAAILQQHGRPILVAARYLPQQYLIGPALFPYYLMTLRKAAPFALLIIFLARASSLLFVHTLPQLVRGIAISLGQLIPDLLYFAAWITIAIAIAEYVYNRNHAKPFGLTWDPTKLPPIKPRFGRQSHANRIGELLFHCFYLLYVLAIPTHLFLFIGPGETYLHMLSAHFAPIWHTFYIAFVIVLVFQLAAKTLALNPTFDSWRIPFDLLTRLASIGCTAIMLTTHTYFISTDPAVSHTLLFVANFWMGMSCRIVFLIGLLALLIETWKHYGPTLRSKSLAF
jgi:hypothetical protein